MEFKQSKSIYQQIAERLADEILSGEYLVGDRVPSVREYAASVMVNANTVMRSYDYLQTEGVIFNKRGIGYFVADDAIERIKAIHRKEFLNGEMNYFFSRLRALGITPDELKQMYEQNS